MSGLRNALALLRGQLWFIPALFVLASLCLAYLLLAYGALLTKNVPADQWWLYSGGARTAHDLLTLAANQLGPRLIQIFLGDRQIQVVLGLFIGTILYVILVLRTIDDTLDAEGVPHLAVTTASLLTIICLLALLLYVHKVARGIVADNVIEAVTQTCLVTLSDILSDDSDILSEKRLADHSDAEFPAPWTVALLKSGYLQVVYYQSLLSLAREHDIRLAIRVKAGDYLLSQGAHVGIQSASEPGEELCEWIRAAFTIWPQRTPAQDPGYGLRRLAEIAARAFSLE